MRLADGRTFSLAVSIGAAVFPRDGDSSEALLAAADARMYQDKHRWRDNGERRSGDTFPAPAPPAAPQDVAPTGSAFGMRMSRRTLATATRRLPDRVRQLAPG